MISKKRRNFLFFEAGILTLLIYITALILTGVLDNYRFDFLDSEQAQFDILDEGLLAQTYFLDNFGNDISCDTFLEQINHKNIELRKFGEDIGNFGSLFLKENLKDSDVFKRRYYLNQINLYSQIENYNNICSKNIIPVFYFFSESSSFDVQGAYLEQFALNHRNETFVFSFDINFEDDLFVEDLKKTLNVKASPFVRIGNKTLSNGQVSSLNEISLEFLKQRGDLK